MKPKVTKSKLNANKQTQSAKNSAHIENAGAVIETPVTDTLIKNYMPYAMSVIVSRALPEIDGFKPAHRKLLYTMYKMGLVNGGRTKSANIVGQTMRLNPHGDTAIYETMVRLSRGNESLLIPLVDSKGNFGKAYSRDMAYAASRYTEAKLESVCNEVFGDLDYDAADFVPNYDNTTTEPALLPVKFPTILANDNIGIAVSMASNICGFNLTELCDTTIALIRDNKAEIINTLPAPDFPGGGYLLYDENALKTIYETGRGSIRLRARYNYDKDANVIEITEIPPTASIESIMDKLAENLKLGKLKEISDARDETDLSGLKIAVDLKRGSDPDIVMAKLFRLTPLEDTFSCNFNLLIGGRPRVCGVREILLEWTEFRADCVKRKTTHKRKKAADKLHLLKGLAKILLDIDRAIKIIRETEEETEVTGNLMLGFGIDEIQAEYVAEIKLRHLNRGHILNRTEEISALEKEIAELQAILDDKKKIYNIIISELREISAKYAKPRKTLLLYNAATVDIPDLDETPDYPVWCTITDHGYFYKFKAENSEPRLKDDDTIVKSFECKNKTELLVFTDKCNVYKTACSEFSDKKAKDLGDYLGGSLGFASGETLISVIPTDDYTEILYIFFANGKCGKVPLNAYETKQNRKKLLNAVSELSPVVALIAVPQGTIPDLLLTSGTKKLIFSGALVNMKSTRDTQGVQVFNTPRGFAVESAVLFRAGMLTNADKFVSTKIPSGGFTDTGEQLRL
ncbi:MAG: topoisomerase IV [Oscillospiraceae bacterium]|jgi:DNA gyrase subunit A|nr:topoisomerase IV [Oscillospiraceae bacterium]